MKNLKILSVTAVKYTPILFGLCAALNIILFSVGTAFMVLEYIWLIYYFILLSAFLIWSLTFKFCVYHRLMIYYSFIVYIFFSIDKYIGLPISSIVMFNTLCGITAITLIAVIITYLKYGDRKISQKDKLTD